MSPEGDEEDAPPALSVSRPRLGSDLHWLFLQSFNWDLVQERQMFPDEARC